MKFQLFFVLFLASALTYVNGQPLAKAIETAKPHLPMLTYALDEIRQNDHLTEKQKKQQISLAIFKLVSSVRSRLDHDEQQSLDAFVDIYMQKISKELAEESVTSEVRSSQLIQNAVNQLEYALNDFVQTLEKEEKNEDLKTNSEETMSEDEDYEQVDFSFNFDDWNVNPFLRKTSKHLPGKIARNVVVKTKIVGNKVKHVVKNNLQKIGKFLRDSFE